MNCAKKIYSIMINYMYVRTCIYMYVPPPPPPRFSTSGQLAVMKETADSVGEDIPTSLEVGLLGLVRKVLVLLPDSLVDRVVGSVLKHDCLLAMAHNQDIVVRTAVVRVSTLTINTANIFLRCTIISRFFRYLKVTIFCRYYCLWIVDFVHFTGIIILLFDWGRSFDYYS